MDNEELKNILTNNLIQYRKANKLTQAELAEKLNYSDKAISKWERGDGLPDIFVINQIAQIYGITPNELLTEQSTGEIAPAKKPTKLSDATKRIIILLSFGLVWFVASLIYSFFGILAPNLGSTWLVFIYAVPVSLLVVFILICIWGTNLLKFIFLSLFSWTLILSFYFTFNITNIWLLFICCAIFQVLIILWFWLKSEKRKIFRRKKISK